MQEPSASVPALARGLAATRKAIDALSTEPDAVFTLNAKEQQFIDAINTALGISVEAIASVPGPIVPGQRVTVETTLTNRGSVAIDGVSLELAAASPGWALPRAPITAPRLGQNGTLHGALTVTVPENAPPTRPYFERASIADARYTLRNRSQFGRPAAEPELSVTARYTVDGVAVQTGAPVERREPHLPYGEALRELMVVPTLAVNVTPRAPMVPMIGGTVKLVVELVNNNPEGARGRLTLQLPPAPEWTARPDGVDFRFTHAGERSTFQFDIAVKRAAMGQYGIGVVATSGGRAYTEGYDLIDHRDLETRYLYRRALPMVRGVDVKIAPGLKVGYVMGIGDEVPAGIAQLGASVTLLAEQDLASADLTRYDAIVTGTRAYAVREDLKTYNRRLLDYAQQGGNLIILYNTQEFVPDTYAPFPAQLPARAEEVSEEDSPVEILAPSHPLFTTPNRITNADFDGWVEQRGSKFFTEWDAAYTPLISTHDQGQAPQRGGWLTANYGKGHYTYCAYAFHRQLPYGVPGAYRLLANLLSLGK